jgi:hypothetical protein
MIYKLHTNLGVFKNYVKCNCIVAFVEVCHVNFMRKERAQCTVVSIYRQHRLLLVLCNLNIVCALVHLFHLHLLLLNH